MNQPEESTEAQQFTQVACTQYFPDMNDFLAETVEDMYKMEVRRILQKGDKPEKMELFDESSVDEFVSLLFSGIDFGIHHYEQGIKMFLLYKLEAEGLVYPKTTEVTKDNKWIAGKYLPSVQKMVKKQIEKIKAKIDELKNIEESFTDFRYVCHRNALCQDCIGYTPNELITKLEEYRCRENEDITQPLSTSTYDEIKRCTIYFKSRLMEFQKKWESFLYHEIMNVKK
jgi:hypothetical protein